MKYTAKQFLKEFHVYPFSNTREDLMEMYAKYVVEHPEDYKDKT